MFNNNLPIYNSQYYPSNITLYGSQQMNNLVHPSVSALVNKLQNIVLKQQLVINNLLAKASLQEAKLEESRKMSFVQVKMEADSGLQKVHEDDPLMDYYSTETLGRSPCDNKIKHTDNSGIIRRNGFKQANELGCSKAEEEEDTDSDDSYSTQPELSTKIQKKSVKEFKSPKNLSKAKHLWVNYGRRILEHAVGEIAGVMQDRLKHLAGKLNSKKDFERTFQIKENDSEEDREFKTVLGNIAIDFVRNKASTTFENSKYKQEMITQRHTVSAWIERLISC